MVLKCPICCNNAEITNKGLAHEKVKAECYCENCDASFEIIYTPGSKSFKKIFYGAPVWGN